MQRREKRGGSWQITLGLRDTRLLRKGIEVVRCNIEDLMKFSQCLGETTKVDVGKGVLGKYVNIARVESLSLVEIHLAPLPLASPALDIGQRFRNPAAVGQERTCLLKVTHCRVVI